MKKTTQHTDSALINSSQITNCVNLSYGSYTVEMINMLLESNLSIKNIILSESMSDKINIALKDTFSKCNYHLVNVECPDEALSYMSKESFNLILVETSYSTLLTLDERNRLDEWDRLAKRYQTPILYLEPWQCKKRDFRSYYNDVN